MKQPDGINELGNHHFDDAGAFVVIFREQPESRIETSAAFAGFNQRGVKDGQPAAGPQTFGKRPARGQFVEETLQRRAE